MRTIYKNIVLAALAFSALACTKEDDFASSYLSDPNAVHITAQVGTNEVTGGFTRSNPLGTAEEQAKFNSGDAIAVTADGQDAVTYTFDGTAWTPESGKYLKWESSNMNFIAWYPVGKNNSSATNFSVPTEYTEDNTIADADYMVYTGTNSNTEGNSISLTMVRKMVRIVIEPTLNEQFPSNEYSISGIKVHANTSGYYVGNLQTGTIEVTALEQNGVYYALLAPTTADDNRTFLTVTVTDGTNSQNLTVKGIPATVAGNSYEYTLTVGKTVATVGTPTVKNWNGGTIGEGEAKVVSCNLPEGKTFNLAILKELDDNPGVKAIKFVANLSADEMNSAKSFTEPTYIMPSNSKYRIIDAIGTNPKTLEICTDAEVFMFNSSCYRMFTGGGSIFTNWDYITTIDFGNCVNTSNVESMTEMFYCSGLTSLDLSSFNTSNVTSMKFMFYWSPKLTSIDLSSFNTSNVNDMSYMFQRCSKLSSLNLAGEFKFIDNVNVKGMFSSTGSLVNIKVNEDGYKYLKDKDTSKGNDAQYVKPDGTPWT